MGLAGDRMLAADFAEYGRLLADEATAASASAPSQSGPLALIVGGATLLVAGLLILTPVMIGRLGAVAGRLPLSPRLAFRDAARHRHRTGPATGAIAMAVAGSVVLSFILAGTFRAEELRHVPALPPHVLAVEPGEADAVAAQAGARAAAAVLPEARTQVLRQPLRPPAEGEQAGRPEDLLSRAIYVMPGSDEDANCEDGGCVAGGHMAMAGSDDLNAVAAGGSLDDEARAALAEGKVLVFGPALVTADGRVRLEVGYDEVADRSLTVTLPAHLATRRLYTGLPYGLVPASVAREQGWETAPSAAFVDYAASATRDEVDTALSAAEQVGAAAFVEDGPDVPSQAILLAIAAVAGFVTLVGVAISVSLSAAEGRADLATLAAVGAPPRRRRALAASQAVLVGGLGCALGVAFGTFVAYTARTTTGAPELVFPWLNLAAIGVVVPLLAVLVATVFTPSRLPLTRRVT